MTNNRLLRISEVAEHLNVSVNRAYEIARSGLLPAVRIGRRVRVDSDQLQAWVAAGGTPLPRHIETSQAKSSSFGPEQAA